MFAYVSFSLEHTTFYGGIYDGHDILLGGAGDDVLVVGGALPEGVAPDPDYLDGGEGTDYLRGEVGADRLLGGDGDDTLRGDNLPDGWPSLFFTSDSVLIHVPGQADFSATGGADFLEGGAATTCWSATMKTAISSCPAMMCWRAARATTFWPLAMAPMPSRAGRGSINYLGTMLTVIWGQA